MKMEKFFISIGIINKKMLFTLIYIILYSLVHIYDLKVEYDEIFEFIDGFGSSLGELFSFFVKEQTNRYHRQYEHQDCFAKRARYTGGQYAVSGIRDKELRSLRKRERNRIAVFRFRFVQLHRR